MKKEEVEKKNRDVGGKIKEKMCENEIKKRKSKESKEGGGKQNKKH